MHISRSKEPMFGDGYEAFGCTVNQIGVEELFAKYESCGFLYAAKRERLNPYLPLIIENWKRSMSPVRGRLLHDVVVCDNLATGAWASLSYWACCNRAVHSQHLVSCGKSEASRATLLASQSEANNRGVLSSQNWFRAENRYPSRVFGSCTLSLGPDNAVINPYSLMEMRRDSLPPTAGDIQVHRCTDAERLPLYALANRLCGCVQANADEWTCGDIELAQLDEQYKEVGLRRYRRVFIATAKGIPDPIGIATAYRGPLGLSFSFLENRCELWLDPYLDDERYTRAIAALVNVAAETYNDFELPIMLVTTDECAGNVMLSLGASLIQKYSRSLWLRPGFAAWYKHVDSFYSRVFSASLRHKRIATNGAAT
ncbi:MAG: hypothetical protein JNK16_13215 [Phycisphaerales bacterium]|nr:hypothetical protein [Phycisphaerales bacterium]